MKILGLFLEIIGLGWIILTVMFLIFGGRVLIQLKNPMTKEFESITDVTIIR